MITITAMKWAPPFAAGNVRDHRLRWILNEVGWPYEVRLVDAAEMASATYRTTQPFGQVPFLAEDGRPALFETGAVVIDIASRAGRLIPPEGDERALVVTWVVAALNSVAPFLMASVLKIARNLGLLDDLPALASYQDRCLDRPAYRQAIAQQCAEIARHEMADMKYPDTEKRDG